MPQTVNDDIFNTLVAIKDKINQQIPFAANRYEAFHCPPLGIAKADVLALKAMHLVFLNFFTLQCTAMEEMASLYQQCDNPQALARLFHTKSNAFYIKLERILRLQKSFNADTFETLKPKLLAAMRAKLPDLYTRGTAALVIDEDVFIEDYIETLQHTTPSDRQHLIEPFATILRTRERAYTQRHEYTNKLVDIRENLSSNFFMTTLTQALTTSRSMIDKDTEKKHADTLQRAHLIQTGLYHHTHKSDSGFCDEHSCLALILWFKQSYLFLNPHRIEKVSIAYLEGDGHTFLVIDRAKDSELNDIRTWGDNAIIFDAWHQLVCYANHFYQLNKQYHLSFPTDGQWHTLKFSTTRHSHLANRIRYMNQNLLTSKNTEAETRETRIIEEYALAPIQPNSALYKHLTKMVNQYRPVGFIHPIQFYLTNTGVDLMKFIPGFRVPTIAVHYTTLQQLAAGTLSLTAVEFSMAVILQQLKTAASFFTRLSLSHDSQHRIDVKAMEHVGSTDACIEYLRTAAALINTNDATSVTINTYENKLANFFNVIGVTTLGPAERIKALQTSIAAGSAKHYTRKMHYAKPAFCRSLLEDDYLTPKLETQYITIQTPAGDLSASQQRIDLLNQLIQQLPQCHIELLAYELNDNSPSVRLRQFARIITSMQIDYDNPAEVAVVDALVDRAHELKVPGFRYLYYALTSPWGPEFQDTADVICTAHTIEAFRQFRSLANAYFIHQAEGSLTPNLYYINHVNAVIPIDIDAVDGLADTLKRCKNFPDVRGNKYKQIEYYLYHYERLRPLGFFKTVQAAITAFTQATTYEEALARANELMALKNKYASQLCDEAQSQALQANKDTTVFDATRDVAEKRLYEPAIGRNIKWVGFDFSDPKNPHPHLPFFPWAKQDKSGLIAEVLFRLGFSGEKSDNIDYLTHEQAINIAKNKHASYIQWFGALPPHLYGMTNKELYNFLNTRDKRKALNHQIVHSFNVLSLTDEEAFIHFYDNNLPLLINPVYDYNIDSPAVNILLEQFFRIAQFGTTDEKALVKSFFFGRDDKRDLYHLLDSPDRIGLHLTFSPFITFLYFNHFKGQAHTLFYDEPIETLLNLKLMKDYCNITNYSLNSYCALLRVTTLRSSEHALEEAFAVIEAQKLSLSKEIVLRAYFNSGISISLFTRLMSEHLTVRFVHNSYTISERLTYTVWPPIHPHALPHFSIEALLNYYAIFDTFLAFPNSDIQTAFGELILARLDALPSATAQIPHLEYWLLHQPSKSPLSDISLKNYLISRLVQLYAVHYGKDNGSDDYFENIKPLMTKLHQQLYARDKKTFMSSLLTALEAQGKLCDYVGLSVDPEDYNRFDAKSLKKSREGFIALIKVATLFNVDDTHQRALLEFLSAPLSRNSLSQIQDYARGEITSSELARIFSRTTSSRMNSAQNNKDLDTLFTALYHQFWDRSLVERAAMIEQLFIPASKTLSDALQAEAYEKGLSYVAQKLFPAAGDVKSDDYLALCVMQSYLKTADNYIRSYLLTAMLVAANTQTGAQSSIGKRLVTVCEHMGPAYVKLVQAIHSHPDTSDAIRADLAHIKGKANPPHRWSLLRQFAEVVQPEDRARIKHVGPLLGSASYNLALAITLDNDETAVLLMLREDAENTAKKGFSHIRATINHCQHPAVLRQRLMMEQTIDEAARLSENEMNKEASDEQSRLAEQIYPRKLQFLLNRNLINITIETARILQSDLGYRIITRMHGVEFNDLPSNTPQEEFVKRTVAQAVITMELQNILRGQQFDSDRHGNQLRVQIKGQGTRQLDLQLGLYDFGEMSLTAPTDDELHQLADVLKNMQTIRFWGKNIDEVIADRINTAVTRQEPTHFLMRIRKAFLALHDFQAYLSKADFQSLLSIVANQPDIHPLLKAPLQQLTNPLYTFASQLYSTLSTFSLFSRQPNPQPKHPPTQHKPT